MIGFPVSKLIEISTVIHYITGIEKSILQFSKIIFLLDSSIERVRQINFFHLRTQILFDIIESNKLS